MRDKYMQNDILSVLSCYQEKAWQDVTTAAMRVEL
jgi:hypothetical protein